jgi:hypothetical protein
MRSLIPGHLLRAALGVAYRALLVPLIGAALFGAQAPSGAASQRGESAPVPALKPMGTLLFIGNSFLFGTGSAVRFYRAHTVTDLNGGGIGGVPALFKAFTTQAGLDFTVSLETASGKGLDYHFAEKADLIGRPWDRVVMLGFSLLDRDKPGDPALLIKSARQVAELLHRHNPQVDIRLIATWSRADQVYPEKGHWHGKPIGQMARDIRAAYDRAATGTPLIRGVIPVGEAWNRAFETGVADPNPYDGIAYGQLDLWTYDHYHPSTYGYYLEALMVFGDLTGLDPRSLGRKERSAFELGLSQTQAAALQKVAFDELTAQHPGRVLRGFAPRASAQGD